jgi:hypothetical protein
MDLIPSLPVDGFTEWTSQIFAGNKNFVMEAVKRYDSPTRTHFINRQSAIYEESLPEKRGFRLAPAALPPRYPVG